MPEATNAFRMKQLEKASFNHFQVHWSHFGILHICQSHSAIRESRLYPVLMSEYETQLAYLWQSRSFCWHIIEVQVHSIIFTTYHYVQSIPTYLPIAFGIKTVRAILSPCVRKSVAKP